MDSRRRCNIGCLLTILIFTGINLSTLLLFTAPEIVQKQDHLGVMKRPSALPITFESIEKLAPRNFSISQLSASHGENISHSGISIYRHNVNTNTSIDQQANMSIYLQTLLLSNRELYFTVLRQKISCLMQNHKRPRGLMFLYHMRKTAGTSLRNILCALYSFTYLKTYELEGITLNDACKISLQLL